MAHTDKRLKIAVLHRIFRSDAGGAEAYAVAVALELAKRHEVHVFAQEMDASLRAVTYHPIALYFKRPRWLNQLVYALASWWQTRKGFDIVHSHENTWHGDVQTVHVIPMRCKPKKSPFYWLKLLTSPRLCTYTALEFFRFKGPAHRLWVSVSHPLQQQLSLMRPALPLTRLCTISPGIYPWKAVREASSIASNVKHQIQRTKVLLWVGNDALKKNLSTVLHAMTHLDNTFHLWVVGKAAPHQAWYTLAQSMGLSERVKIMGVISDMDVAYSAADILLHPTLEDTFGMVVLEAMSRGVPVVVSSEAYCGISADLTHGLNAYVVKDPMDAIQLADAVNEIMQEGTYDRYQVQASAFAQQHLWTDVAKQYELLFQKIAAQ